MGLFFCCCGIQSGIQLRTPLSTGILSWLRDRCHFERLPLSCHMNILLLCGPYHPLHLTHSLLIRLLHTLHLRLHGRPLTQISLGSWDTACPASASSTGVSFGLAERPHSVMNQSRGAVSLMRGRASGLGGGFQRILTFRR
jgi:hypothetical protein